MPMFTIFNHGARARVVITIEQRSAIGLGATQTLLDHLHSSNLHIECGVEGGLCTVPDFESCVSEDRKATVVYGKDFASKSTVGEATVDLRLSNLVRCDAALLNGKDPAVGELKKCWVLCGANKLDPVKADACNVNAPEHQHAWSQTLLARMELCTNAAPPARSTAKTHESLLQEALSPLCTNERLRRGMVAWVDCRFSKACVSV